MQKRRGVILVMYDLPVKTTDNRNKSEKFRKYLINHGYVFLQKSIYVKLFRNKASMKQDIQLLREELPKDGIVNVLPMNLENFKKMMTILGKPFNMLLFSDDIIFFDE